MARSRSKSRSKSRSRTQSKSRSNKTGKKRVLFIAIDGLRPDALVKFAPNLRKLGENNMYTWNSKVDIPISAPSWSTIFSGLSYKRTGITNNAFTGKIFKDSDNNLKSGKEKTIFYHLKKAKKKTLLISAGPWMVFIKLAIIQVV